VCPCVVITYYITKGVLRGRGLVSMDTKLPTAKKWHVGRVEREESKLEFEAGVVDGKADVAVGFSEAAYGLHLVDICL
jgi:hypothetical protein